MTQLDTGNTGTILLLLYVNELYVLYVYQ